MSWAIDLAGSDPGSCILDHGSAQRSWLPPANRRRS